MLDFGGITSAGSAWESRLFSVASEKMVGDKQPSTNSPLTATITLSILEDAEQALSGRAGGALEDNMSVTPIGGRLHDELRRKVTTASLREQKLRHEPITCLTAYDYATARLVDEAGIEMILVGDSAGANDAGVRKHAIGYGG